MTVQSSVLADSINEKGERITTFLLRYPLIIHAELLTHRCFSRNSKSNRAVSVQKLIEDIRRDPYIPKFTRKAKGMASNEYLKDGELRYAEELWLEGMRDAIRLADDLDAIDVQKQHANRPLMPYQHIVTVLTGTDFDNFFKLRCHPDAQPEMQELAQQMQDWRDIHKPAQLRTGALHLPFSEQVIVSVARCARVSYETQSTPRPYSEDLALFQRLFKSGHMSPFEHQAFATPGVRHRNLQGWKSYRIEAENGFV